MFITIVNDPRPANLIVAGIGLVGKPLKGNN